MSFASEVRMKRFLDSISLRNKLLGLIIIVVLFISIGGLVASKTTIYDLGLENAVAKSKSTLTQMDIARTYMSETGLFKMKAQQILKDYSEPNFSKEVKEEILKSVPVVAAMNIGKAGEKDGNYTFKAIAINARNKDNEATSKEKQILEYFKSNAKEDKVEIDEENQILRVYRPVSLDKKQGCLHCHGDPATSPWHNGKDILGYQMENMKDGDLKGAFVIEQSLAAVAKTSNAVTSRVLIVTLGITLLFLTLAFFLLTGIVKSITSYAYQISSRGDKLLTTSDSLNTLSKSLSENSNNTASALQQTTTAIDQIRAMADRNMEDTMQTLSFTEKSLDFVKQGKEANEGLFHFMEGMVKVNNLIKDNADESNKKMSEIIQIFNNISDKLTVINNIAFQTKLLSFNASVEAARAGEAGKGFSVVAQEVGNLANSSGKSAKEIEDMLSASLLTVENIVKDNQHKINSMLDTSSKELDSGSIVIKESAKVFEDISDSITEIHTRMKQVSTATTEQKNGMAEINKAVNNIDERTSDNSISSDKVSVTSNEMKTEANHIKTNVDILCAMLEGSDSSETNNRKSA